MTQSYNLSQLANNLNTAGQLDATDGLSGAVPVANGGTGLATYTIGDIIYASGTTALAKLSDVATGNVLISGGVGVAPSYGKVGLTTHVSGTLPIANGGTNSTATPTAGGVIYGSGTAYAVTAAGTTGQVLTSAGAGTPTWSAVNSITVGTAVATTSGTSVTITGIPATAKRITVLFNNVSTNGTSNVILQIGNTSVETTGYTSEGYYNFSAATAYTTGFGIQFGTASFGRNGRVVLNFMGSNTWVADVSILANSNISYGTGIKTTSAAVDRIRITTVGGVDTFNAGLINILYEQ
jgi:hypothetical protein